MKNNVKNFSQFVNESGLGYGWANRKDLRKELVGGKGQKREYDELSEPDRMELEGLFASINLRGEERAKLILANFTNKLSKFNTLEEIKAALEIAREELDTKFAPGDNEESNWSGRDSSAGEEGYYDQEEEY
jgi:hypothetical protein